ncbi:MAG: LCP family protein [Patescibacteria group bacterium]|nr:LCP family protein [Patescibacteria group bacterium]
MQEINTRQKKPFFIRLLIVIFLTVVCFFLGYSAYYLNSLQRFIATATSQHITVKTATNITPLLNQTNILLLGSDNDQKFTGNPLTQTMMVVHIDYAKKEIDMFSIPRDLWIRMPDRKNYGKIDQAAEYEGIPSAIKVVEQTFGISIDHYAWVGLYGFIKSINAIGGINLQVVHPVLDNSYPTDINSSNPYGYQRLDIQAGMQHMTGGEALQYVRSRHEDLIGDFGRTQRQRELLLAIKDTLFHSKSSLLKIPNIFNSLRGQIKTDVSPAFSLQLGIFLLRNKNIKIKQFTLSPPIYSSIGNSIDGQSIVVANASNSAKLITQIFGKNAGQVTFNNLLNVQGIAR